MVVNLLPYPKFLKKTRFASLREKLKIQIGTLSFTDFLFHAYIRFRMLSVRSTLLVTALQISVHFRAVILFERAGTPTQLALTEARP